MVEHLVLFKLKLGIVDEEYVTIINLFQELKGIIPGLLEVSIGVNITEEIQYKHNNTLGMRMQFESHDQLRDYLLHPLHLKVAEYVLALVDDVSVCDYSI